jgi:DNA-binding LytR/AlgR family response regulator
MKKITAVIIEDVETEAQALKLTINEELPAIEVVGIAHSYHSAIELILKLRPTILFMDIRLGGTYESFDVVNELYKNEFTRFVPVFVTAYGSEEYAVRTIDYAGAMYFRKPLSNEKLQKAMERIVSQLRLNTFNYDMNQEQVEQMLGQLRKNQSPERVAVRDEEGCQVMVKMEDVVYIMAELGKTFFILNNSEEIVSNETLKYHEEHFTKDYDFFRIHNAILLNLAYLKKYHHSSLTVYLNIDSNGFKPQKASQRQGKRLKDYLKLKDLNDFLDD